MRKMLIVGLLAVGATAAHAETNTLIIQGCSKVETEFQSYTSDKVQVKCTAENFDVHLSGPVVQPTGRLSSPPWLGLEALPNIHIIPTTRQ